jgi:hypothetical protein
MARSIWESIAEAVDSFEGVDDVSMTSSGMAGAAIDDDGRQTQRERKANPDRNPIFFGFSEAIVTET